MNIEALLFKKLPLRLLVLNYNFITMTAPLPQHAIVHDDENMTVKVIDTGIEDTATSIDSLKIGVTAVEMIKAILICEESISFQKETIVGLKKKLVADLHVDAGFVSELIGVVKKETHPESGGGVIDKKTKILDAAAQAVVLYPSVTVRPSIISGQEIENTD